MLWPGPPLDRSYARAALWLIALLLFVIVWGGLMRATGSSPGCAGDWPLCGGAVMPDAVGRDATIDLIHRLSSGLLLAGTISCFLMARRRFAPRHPVRRAAAAVLAFTAVEALVGGAIVLLGKTGGDASAGRAIVMSVHVVNTFLLLASAALGAWWSGGGSLPAWDTRSRHAPALIGGLLALLLLGATGAITALSDTLFAVGTLAGGDRPELSPTAQTLVRLRIVHPVLALLTAGGWIALAAHFARSGDGSVTARLARVVGALAVVQIAAGLASVPLLAPIPLRLLHLLFGDLTWIACVLLASEVLAAEAGGRCYNPAACVPTRSSPE